MSAAQAIPISAASPHPAKIPKGFWVPTRPADLAAYRTMSQAAIGVHTLIHVESTGWRKASTRTAIKLTTFATHCGQGERNIQKTITEEETEGRIERQKTSGGYVYKRLRPIDYDGGSTFGNCKKCKEVTEYALDRDVPIPHSLFVNVQQSGDRGMFLLMLLISLETMRWQDGQIWIHPKAISIEEFERRTDLKKSEIEKDLAKLEARGLIASSGRKGSVQTYWPLPQNWQLAGVRLKRLGGNPSPGRKESEENITPVPQPTQNTPKPSPSEFWCKPCGTCLKCREWGPVEIVAAPEVPIKKPIGQARTGPVGEIFAPGDEWTPPWKEKTSRRS
jgi:hypothetical protein